MTERVLELPQAYSQSLLEPASADAAASAAALPERGRSDADEARRMAEGPPVEE